MFSYDHRYEIRLDRRYTLHIPYQAYMNSVQIHVVISNSQIARRWRACNKVESFVANTTEEEEAEKEWRLIIIGNLSKIHTPGGMDDASFEVVESRSSVCRVSISS